MKYTISLIALFVCSITLYAQGTCKLKLKAGSLSGKCKNSYFSSFNINLELETLDSVSLFDQLPLEGTVIVSKKHELPLSCALTERAGYPQILFKSQLGWFTMEQLKIKNTSIAFNIDHDPDVPVTETDLAIIQRAKSLLGNEKSWHKQDDRDCEDDNEKHCYSLFCALQRASIEVEGAYNHRNAIMQKIRHTIVEIFPEKVWEHRLKDFNNMPDTDYKVLMDLLNRVELEVIEELKLK